MGLKDIGTLQGFGITRQIFRDLEEFIEDNRESQRKVMLGTDMLVRAMIMTTKGLAQQKSGGPVAPRRRSVPALAYRIPVQRITGAYFAGWTQRRVGPAHWVLYNDTAEAWFIEHGIFMRVRRPILKMSFLGMLRFIQTTRTADRFLEWVIAPRRSAKGQFQSFSTRMMNTQSLGGMAGPTGRLP